MENLALSALARDDLLGSHLVGSNRKTDSGNVVCQIWWRFGNRPPKIHPGLSKPSSCRTNEIQFSYLQKQLHN